jgi:hypothetical protein
MPEIIPDSPALACSSLHLPSGIEENQSVAPDLFQFSAGDEAAAARDKRGRFADGHSGIPRAGRPASAIRGRRDLTIQAYRRNPEACSALFDRQPWQLRRLLGQFLPPLSAQDPAERLGIRLASIRTPEQALRALNRVWAAWAQGEIGMTDAARISRRIDRRLRALRRLARVQRRLGRLPALHEPANSHTNSGSGNRENIPRRNRDNTRGRNSRPSGGRSSRDAPSHGRSSRDAPSHGVHSIPPE